jgi:LruC domain-containing protein
VYGAYCAPRSAVPGASATRSSNQVVFFEDMLGSGSNDWDYNDFVVRVAATEVISSGALGALTVDYEPLARGASYYHSFRQHIPLAGGWTATLTRFAAGNPSQVLSRSTLAGDGPLDLEIYADTRDALPPATGSFTNSEPAQVGFRAGAQARLEVTLASPAANPDGAAGSAPWDVYLHLPYLVGPQGNEVHRGLYGGAAEIATTGPLAGSALDFVIVHPIGAVAPSWSFEGVAVWTAYPRFVPYQQAAAPADAD